MKRRIFKLGLFLLLGAIINVAVAWGCALWTPLGPFVAYSQSELEGYVRSKGQNPTDYNWMSGDRRTGFGLTRSNFEFRDGRIMGIPSFGIFGPFFYETGWPCRCLAGWWSFRGSTTDALSAPASIAVSENGNPSFTNRVLPLNSIWPGFAINTIFYAAIVWMLFALPGVVRRRMRAHRGRCTACGYDLRVCQTGVCPECGVNQ